VPHLISISLDKKLIFLVMIVSVAVLIITSFLSFNYAEQILKERTSNQLISESTIRGNSIENLFDTRIKDVQSLATNAIIQKLVDELNQEKLNSSNDARIEEMKNEFLIQVEAFQESVGFSIEIEDIKIIGKNGVVFFSLGILQDYDFSQDPTFIKGLEESFVDFEPAENFGKKMVVTVPIFAKDDEKGSVPTGVIISKMRTASIDEILLNRSGLGQTGEIYLVNDDFLMISESRFIENAVFNQKVETLATIRCFENGQEVQGLYQDYRGVWIFGSSYCAKDLGLVLLAEIDQHETIEPILILQDKILQTGIVITLAVGTIAFFLSKSISRGLIKLKNAANEIAQGNFGVRTNLKSTDEVGQLSLAFDTMAKNLQESHIAINLREEIIKQQEDLLVRFSQTSENSCVCIVDIIQSTVVTDDLSDQQTKDFYEIFINSSAGIVKKFGGIVIKNIGDSVLFYFPKIDPSDKAAFKNVLECCLSLGEANSEINKKLVQEGLPGIAYRISVTYGTVNIAKVATSSVDDIFGATVNRCSKINRFALPNHVIIGSDVYENVKTINDYNFKNMNVNPTGGTALFSVYLISRRQ